MKKTFFLTLIILVSVTAIMIPLYVYANPHGHGGHHGGYRAGIWIGGPWWGWGPGPWWGPPYAAYPYPYYSQPPVVIQQQPVYQQPSLIEEEQNYWYYCPDANAYYPYIKNCPKGWLKVVPTQPR
jgi:hypothetical protein